MSNQTHFERIIVDADTALLRAALSVQEATVKIKNNKTGVEWETPFKGVQEALGTTRKGTLGGWVGRVNNFAGTAIQREDIEVIETVSLRADIKDHLAEAEKHFSYFVGNIKATGYADDYLLCIGGVGNFRYDAATLLPYKGKRKDKPLIFNQLKEKVLEQYKSRIHIANDCEADDLLGWYAQKNQAHFKKTGQYKYILAYFDKDMRQLWGPTYILHEQEKGIQYITPFEAAYHFAYQMLAGDLSTDNIQGLPGLNEEICKKYGLRKTKGCGPASAEGILEGCVDAKQLFTNVLDAYKLYYGEGWELPIKENALLFWMQRFEGQRFNILTDLFDKLGIDYV